MVALYTVDNIGNIDNLIMTAEVLEHRLQTKSTQFYRPVIVYETGCRIQITMNSDLRFM